MMGLDDYDDVDEVVSFLFQCCLQFTLSSESNKNVFPGDRLLTKAYPCVFQHKEIVTGTCM